jgi:hypothetical protein
MEEFTQRIPEVFMEKGPGGVGEMIREALSSFEDVPEGADKEALGAIVDSGLMAIESFLRSERSPYDQQDAQAIYMYVKAAFTQGDMMEVMMQLKEMGYNVGEPAEDRGLPNLESYIPRIANAFTSYLRDKLPELGAHMQGPEG